MLSCIPVFVIDTVRPRLFEGMCLYNFMVLCASERIVHVIEFLYVSVRVSLHVRMLPSYALVSSG